MGNRQQADKPPRHVTRHPDKVSLAIPLWVGTMTTSKKLRSKHSHHMTHDLKAAAGVWLAATEMDITTTAGAHVAQNRI